MAKQKKVVLRAIQKAVRAKLIELERDEWVSGRPFKRLGRRPLLLAEVGYIHYDFDDYPQHDFRIYLDSKGALYLEELLPLNNSSEIVYRKPQRVRLESLDLFRLVRLLDALESTRL